MTDNEIIKALEDCAKISKGKCGDMTAGALDLINRQKAEIERLKGKVNLLMKYDERRDISLHARLTEKARAEATKEFAERLKTKASDFEFGKAVWVVYIDNLVKEMVGDDK